MSGFCGLALSAADQDQDHAFKKLLSALENELDILRNENLKLQNDLHAERDKKKKLQTEVSQLSKRWNLECKVCYRQEEKWTVLVCGHMFCWSCVESLEKPRKCPVCRADVMGYFICYPFAG
jgi:predicted nuclease with TOPRIM domain